MQSPTSHPNADSVVCLATHRSKEEISIYFLYVCMQIGVVKPVIYMPFEIIIGERRRASRS